MKYAFAGDRKISTQILKYIISQGYKPTALLVCDPHTQSHANELISLSKLNENKILHGTDFKKSDYLKSLDLDYIICIHFPYIIPEEILKLPSIGVLNLHPAYLPFNKGWHTPSWAIIENTTYGATLHFMNDKIDEGDIIFQEQLEILPTDTAHTLYQKVLDLEFEIFKKSFSQVKQLSPTKISQNISGTLHHKKDLKEVQEIILDKHYKAQDLIDKMRALTTHNLEEAAYFTIEDKKYHIQIKITEKPCIL